MADVKLHELAFDVADHYRNVTHVPCSVLDFSHPADTFPRCPFTDVCAEDCEGTHLHCAELSFRFGGSYVYFCPHSLLFWTSPLISEGVLHYAIIAGPVSVFDPEELAEEFGEQRETVLQRLSTLVALPVEHVHSAAEVLRMCSGWASGTCEATLNEHHDQLDRQSQMNAYIQDLKSREARNVCNVAIESLDKEARLQEAIRCGDKKLAMKMVNELLGVIFFRVGESIAQTRLRIMQLILIISRAAIQGGASEEEIMNISYRCQREINRFSDQEEISRWLSAVLHQFTDMVFRTNDDRYGSVIAQALRFISRNYDREISLKETASAVLLSPTYFSRVFNDEMKITFSQYVNKLRIGKSCRLLLDSMLPVAEIAQLAGFTDQSYFSKVFKQQLGMTPHAYRVRGRFYPEENYEIH